MRNGDFGPSRMDAQLDAANLICGAKTQQNPETTLGIMTTAGKGFVFFLIFIFSYKKFFEFLDLQFKFLQQQILDNFYLVFLL